MVNEQERVKEILGRYLGIQENLTRKIELLNEMRSRRMTYDRDAGLTSIAYDTISVHTNKVVSRVSQIAIKNIDLENEIEEKIEYLTYQINLIKKVLIDVKTIDEELYKILLERYIHKKTWRIISMDLSISEKTCRRKGSKAFELICEMLNKDVKWFCE